jgi:hypothetical protein
MQCESHRLDTPNTLAVQLQISRADLTISETLLGVELRLVDFQVVGEPGAPGLPRGRFRIAVPEDMWPLDLEILTEHWEVVAEKDCLVAPIQPPIVVTSDSSGAGTDRTTAFGTSPHLVAESTGPDDGDGDRRIHRSVSADATRYKEAVDRPAAVARAIAIDVIGLDRVALVEISPVRMTAGGGLELCTSLSLAVSFGPEPRTGGKAEAVAALGVALGRDLDPERVVLRPEPHVSGPDEVMLLRESLRGMVLNGDVLSVSKWPSTIRYPRHTDYLVVTDDWKWDAQLLQRTAQTPGLTAEFQRLASSKKARGLTAEVVTISDIVYGTYGDFVTGSRDLQEVIRRFIKDVRTRWKVRWVLLGGDVSVVPIRTVVCIDPDNTFGQGSSRMTRGLGYVEVALARFVLGEVDDYVVTRLSNHQVVPFDPHRESGSMAPGWRFVDDSSRNKIRICGPEDVLGDGFAVATRTANVATDLYYSCLSSFVVSTGETDPMGFGWPYVFEPEHDWDALDNGFYGQHTPDGTDLDGVVFHTDVSVGRAPVESQPEAATFVNKILAYETKENEQGLPHPPDWSSRIVLVADDLLQNPQEIFPGAANTTGYYIHDTVQRASLLKISSLSIGPLFRLVAVVSDTDTHVIPYKNSSDSSTMGWYFARSNADLSVSETVSNPPHPIPTTFIVVHGSLEVRTPLCYRVEDTAQDPCLQLQEEVRNIFTQNLPEFRVTDRLYRDWRDLSAVQAAGVPFTELNRENLVRALERQPHVVSMYGHGYYGGLCKLDRECAATLQNGLPGFIVYASSCWTAMVDHKESLPADSFGEEMMKNPAGGAVAYIGQSREGWSTTGEMLHRAFFRQLSATNYLGHLVDSRIDQFKSSSQRDHLLWKVVYATILLGDPEMQLHRLEKPRLRLEYEREVVQVIPEFPGWTREPFPCPPPFGVPVTVTAGSQVIELITDPRGTIRIPEEFRSAGLLTLTAHHPDFITARLTVDVVASGSTTWA